MPDIHVSYTRYGYYIKGQYYHSYYTNFKGKAGWKKAYSLFRQRNKPAQ